MKKEEVKYDYSSQADIRNRVMDEIKKKKVRMRQPLFFLAQKMGLQSILALVIFIGAFSLSAGLFFLKKIGALKFLAFGFPGIKTFLFSFPYDYLALVIVTIFLANYILKKIYFSACLVSRKIISLFLFALVAIIGAFFFMLGIGSAVKF